MKESRVGKRRILVVEDELGIAKVCQRTLVSEDYQVDIATNGAIAEGMLEEAEYALVLIDIRIPVMNGKQLHQYITERYPGLVSRVVFTTGDVIGSDTQYFLEQSDRPVLVKPFTPEELKAIVRETLERLD